MLVDASGYSVTKPILLIRKRPVTSRNEASPCQGGCRGFDPRFPLQTNRNTPQTLDARSGLSPERAFLGEFKREFKRLLFRPSIPMGSDVLLLARPTVQHGDQDARKTHPGARRLLEHSLCSSRSRGPLDSRQAVV
jgi:hypothetical protein